MDEGTAPRVEVTRIRHKKEIRKTIKGRGRATFTPNRNKKGKKKLIIRIDTDPPTYEKFPSVIRGSKYPTAPEYTFPKD